MDRSAYDAYFRLETTHFWRVQRRALLLDTLAQALPPRRPLRLLDVGGACTLISKELSRFGEVVVVEPDAATVELGRSELGLDARVGSLPHDLPVEGLFDAITLFDVLEHLDEERPALEALRARVQVGGLLLVTVPALRALWSSHDVAVHHRRRYHRADLVQVLEAGGFEVERCTYFSSLLLPVLGAQRLADRARGLPARAEYKAKAPPALLNGAFDAVMAFERKLLARADLPLGSSLLALCRLRS